MNKFLVIPDSFKGTLSASEVCAGMEEGIIRAFRGRNAPTIRKIPAADGGEGTVDAFLAAAGGRKVFCKTTDPLSRPIEGFYGIIPADSGDTAVIEMAAAAGLTLLSASERDPQRTTTFGVGTLILEAVKNGCKRILLGLGGSCTNDFGCGAAAALGVVFYDEGGRAFVPTGGTLSQIASYDDRAAKRLLSDVKLTLVCDVTSPVYGKEGAAYVFAMQKGADEAAVQRLDENLRAVAAVVQRQTGQDVQQFSGGGAAGAMGAGMRVFLNAESRSGIDALLDVVSFAQCAENYDCVLTGEGCFDAQSLSGKVCIGIAKRAKALRLPVIVIAGGLKGDLSEAYRLGVSAAFSINRLPLPLSESAGESYQNLVDTTESIIRIFNLTIS